MTTNTVGATAMNHVKESAFLSITALYTRTAYVNIEKMSSNILHAKSLQSCPTLCIPMGCSPPGSSVHGIFQARVQEWVAMSSSPGELPNPGIKPESLTSNLHWQVGSLPIVPPEKH